MTMFGTAKDFVRDFSEKMMPELSSVEAKGFLSYYKQFVSKGTLPPQSIAGLNKLREETLERTKPQDPRFITVFTATGWLPFLMLCGEAFMWGF